MIDEWSSHNYTHTGEKYIGLHNSRLIPEVEVEYETDDRENNPRNREDGENNSESQVYGYYLFIYTHSIIWDTHCKKDISLLDLWQVISVMYYIVN